MDEPEAKSLADDPDFLSSLSELDRGLDVPSDHIRKPHAHHALTAVPEPTADEPDIAADVHGDEDLDLPIQLPTSDRRTPASGGRRALIDLFPPPPDRAAVPPPLDIAPPPRLVRSRSRELELLDNLPTLTYETFYGFAERPFSEASDLKFLYHSAGHDEAAQAMLAAFRQREGIVVLTGEAGVGKTMVCRAVSAELGRKTLTAFVAGPVQSIDELLRTVLVEFGVVARDNLARGHLMAATRDQLVGALRNFAASLSVLDASAVVFIENAESLAIELLDEVGDLLPGGDSQLQIVLVGEPELLARLDRDGYPRLKELIAVRITLRRLADDEIAGYVMHRMMVAGNGVRVGFDDEACAALAAFSRGIPRLVNLLCGEALTLGQHAAATVIDAALVRAGAAHLNLTASPGAPARWLQIALAVLLCALLMLVGAATAGWFFRDQVARTVVAWTSVPRPPAPPLVTEPPPLPPIVEPAETPERTTGTVER